MSGGREVEAQMLGGEIIGEVNGFSDGVGEDDPAAGFETFAGDRRAIKGRKTGFDCLRDSSSELSGVGQEDCRGELVMLGTGE